MDEEKNNKKVTVRDVAKAAGVSVATVSYCMNDTPGQKISPETRKKVLQMANLLNYRPNHAAKILAQGRNNVIGLAFSVSGDTPFKCIETALFVQELTHRFHRMNYEVMLMELPDREELTVNRMIDAIVAIDLPLESFRLLSGNYLVPVIGVDMIIDDDLFYRIYTDYPRYIRAAAEELRITADDLYVITEPFRNLEFTDHIAKTVPEGHLILTKELDEKTLSELKNRYCVILGQSLGAYLKPYLTEGRYSVIAAHNEKKANLTVNILLNTIDRIFDVSHDHPV